MAKALNPQSALPLSESSLHERLLALESKQLAYRSLSHRLLQLPHKLRRRALVPVGPRIYLPGELVRTNEILVLLGSAGEATYFAERSAWQAHEIVRRRLGRVERGLRELLDEADDESNVSGSPTSKVRVEAAGGNNESVIETKANDVKTKSSPSVPVIENVKETNDSATGNKAMLSTGTEPVSVLRSSTNQPRATTAKKRVRFSDPLIHPSLKSKPQPCFISPPKPKTKGKKKKKAVSSSSSNKLEKADLHSTISTLENESGQHVPKQYEKSYAATNSDGPSNSKVLDELRLAVAEAQKQVLDGGIVNITEVYEGEEDTPSRVELPPGFEPDKSVNFGEDSEDFLDMTGAKHEVEDEEVSREAYLDALAEVEKESQAEEERVEVERRRKELEREKKEFGKGFAKGFFGAAPKKRTQPEKAQMSKSVTGQRDVPSTEVTSSSSASAIGGVVERKPTRKAKRRNRRPRSGAGVFPPSMPAALLQDDTLHGMEMERLGDEARSEQEGEGSVFRKLRGLDKDAVGLER